ncbi:hypothetical protein [Mesorhizobium sp. M0478]|uniref:hypothetical protein n=1 Tax=Mesorhizobium sp. M0478 TaxID=2956947 RepID=UPI00333A6C34
MYGAQASKDGKEHAAPAYWQEHADAWLQGFDGVRVGEPLPTVSDNIEAELNDSAVNKPENAP